MTPFARLHERVERLLFDRHHLPVKTANWLLDVLRYPFALVRDLLTGELNLRAMGLVYTTLLSLVPLAAFAFAVLKGLGVHRDLEPLIYEFLRPIGVRATELKSGTSAGGEVEFVGGCYESRPPGQLNVNLVTP